MKAKQFLGAALAGVFMGFFAPVVPPVSADTLHVLRGAASRPLNVPMNRAVVVESETPFAELSIANPQIADISTLSDRTIYVLGKTPGRTTLTLLGLDGRLITSVEVHVAPDIAEFKERLRQIMPNENIEVRTANDGVVLSGTVSSQSKLDRALALAQRYAPERVSNLMIVGGNQQVMLKVQFAEMQRSVRKSLSNSLLFTDGGSVTGGSGGYGNTSALNSSGTFSGSNPSTGQLRIGFGGGSMQLGLVIDALESQGVVRTLAEPNLIALSGQEARFLAGGEYPIPVVVDGSASIQYRPFGIELNFTPTVIDDGTIQLQLATAVSSIDSANGITASGISVNAFRKREASTTVEMRDGESFAIAGLLQDDFQDLKGQVPWLGDIPVLGVLFRSVEYERSQSELVIIVTPHLVNPVRGDSFALPTDRVTPPTERDLFLNGRLTGNGPRSGAAREVANQQFSGSYGYVMD
ncbi:MAG: type II and III secretion system protein family protein [Pseudomonadota bacterium]